MHEPRYLDDDEIRRRDEEQKQEVEEYSRFRENVKTWREGDKQNRNTIKIRQLEECEELQVYRKHITTLFIIIYLDALLSINSIMFNIYFFAFISLYFSCNKIYSCSTAF